MSTIRYRLLNLIVFLAVTAVWGFQVASLWTADLDFSTELGTTGLLMVFWLASLVGAWSAVWHLDRGMRG